MSTELERVVVLLEKIAPVVEKIEEISKVLPIIEALGDFVVFRKNEVDKVIGLNKQTLSKSKTTFEEVGARRVYVDLKTVAVYNSKRKKLK